MFHQVLGEVFSCVHMMGLESRRWQITCNCDLLWRGLTLWRSTLCGNTTQRGTEHGESSAELMLGHWGDKAMIIHFSCDLRRRSEGFIDGFTWRELEVRSSGFETWGVLEELCGKVGVAELLISM